MLILVYSFKGRTFTCNTIFTLVMLKSEYFNYWQFSIGNLIPNEVFYIYFTVLMDLDTVSPLLVGCETVFAGARHGTRTLQSVLFVSMETSDGNRTRRARCPTPSLVLNTRISPLTLERRVLDI